MKLFGYKRWYELEAKNKNYCVKRKLKKKGRKIKIDEIDDNQEVKDKDFIDKLTEYKTPKLKIMKKKLKDKFSKNNILFKIKESERFPYTIKEQSEKLSKFNKDKSKKNRNQVIYTRKNYEKELNEYLKNNQNNNSMDIPKKKKIQLFELKEQYKPQKLKINNEIEIELKKFSKDEKFDKKSEYYEILYIDNTNLCETRQKIDNIIQLINKNIYENIEKIQENPTDLRNIKEHYKEKLNIENIYKEIENLKKEINSNNRDDKNSLISEIIFNLNLNKKKTSENKLIFALKLENYLRYDQELTQDDCKEFIISELIHFDLLRRTEKEKELNKKEEKKLIKIYIKNDKHTAFQKREKGNKSVNFVENVKSSKKIMITKELINLDTDTEIVTIVEKYNLCNLVDKLLNKIRNKNSIDTFLFDVYKKHYQENVQEAITTYINEDVTKKELAKLTYRYIKGRIEKIISYNIKEDEKIKKIFCKDQLREKIKTRVEQYILENLIYLGKVKLLSEKIELTAENIPDKFIEYGIKEELELEFLNFVSATNFTLNEIYDTNKDYFGGGENELTPSQPIGRINFKEDEFKKFLNCTTGIRSEIIHRGNKKCDNNRSIFDFYNNINQGNIVNQNESENYKNLIKKINSLKIEDDEICKALNFDIIFKNKQKKELISKINNLKNGQNTQKIFCPNFSKLVPLIKNKLQIPNIQKEENRAIVENAIIYLNKVLYEKLTSKELEFYTKENEVEKLDIEREYKNAQRKASKGDKRAISKFQDYFIKRYFDYILQEYDSIYDFSYIKDEDIKDDEKGKLSQIILKTTKKDIAIGNDFEYITLMCAFIMKDNTYINKMRNRLFATDIALNKNYFEKVIYGLDQIIAINNTTFDYYEHKKNLINIKNEIAKDEDEKEILSVVENKDSKITYHHLGIYIKKKCNIKNKLILKAIEELKGNELSNTSPIKDIMAKIKGNKEDNKKRKECYDTLDKHLKTEPTPKEEIKKGDFITNISNLQTLEAKMPLKYIDKYENFIDENLKRDDKFSGIYYQKTKLEEQKDPVIYKARLFNCVINKNFDRLYEKFSKENMQNLKLEEIEELKTKDVSEKINKVNKFLTLLNNTTKGKSKNYRDEFSKKIKNSMNDLKFILKNSPYENYQDFEADFYDVQKYKQVKSIIEMSPLIKISNYLIEINWKLAIQISRVERDIDYIYTGLLELKTENKQNIAMELKERLIKICNDLKVSEKNFEAINNLKEEFTKNDEDNIRNYISHFYLLRKPFENKNLKEIIDEVSKLSEYRTRYNNTVYNSCFEVFKKEFSLNYDNLKKKFRLSGIGSKRDMPIFEISKILTQKKVSSLDLKTSQENLLDILFDEK